MGDVFWDRIRDKIEVGRIKEGFSTNWLPVSKMNHRKSFKNG